MHIANHKLVGPNVNYRQAQSCGGRFKKPVRAITAHDTAGSLKKFSSVKWFESPECGTSAHVVIELDGTVTQMVPFDTIAFHAGRSSWKGMADCNKDMIGIEIANPGMMVKRGEEAQLIYKITDKNGRIVEKVVERFPLSKCVAVNTKEHGKGWALPYTDAQIKAFTEVCKALADAYDSIDEIVTHWMISPGRKVDTTPAFPLAQIREAVFHPEKLEAVPPPPEPQTVAAPKPPNPIVAGAQSRTVFTLIMSAILWVAQMFTAAVNMGLDWVMWAVGLLPAVATEVKDTLSNAELMAGWLKLNWPAIAFYVALGCIGVAIIRHINDKRALAQAQAQAEQAEPQQ